MKLVELYNKLLLEKIQARDVYSYLVDNLEVELWHSRIDDRPNPFYEGVDCVFIFEDCAVQLAYETTAEWIDVANIHVKKRDDLSVPVSGTGKGTKIIMLLKKYVETHNKVLLISGILKSALSYWNKFSFLTKSDRLDIDSLVYEYDPTQK